ncbi:6523_t:CDS:2 [Cetraspora pellucida]|uniref:6523_t:CDS:1 n=1 Tax=Cetraspora pellucida TaxID=1433469 RepID=A0A9N9C6W7_9GLOM|nr:6523_t:CDS:2 [Cetraspora pellucida]
MYSKTLAMLLRSKTSIHFILVIFFFQFVFSDNQNHTQDDSVSTLTIPLIQWKYLEMTGDMPQGLKDFGFGYNKLANKLIVFGGTTQDNSKSSATYIADLNAMTWSSLQTAQRPGARSDMIYGMDIYAGYRNTFVITGGKGDGDIVYNDTWAFDITYNTWSQITNVISTSGPVPQIYGAVGGIDTSVQGGSQTIPNTTMWLTHGTNGKDFFTDIWAVVFGGTLATSGNFLTVSWTKISTAGPLPPGRKATGGTILPDGKMVMYGGCNLTSSSDCATSDVWSLNIGSNSNSGVPSSNSPIWSQKGECLGAREGVAMVNNAMIGVVSYRAQAISFGGKLPGKLTVDKDGEVGVLDANGGVWVRVLPQADPKYIYPKVRSGARMVAVDNGISNVSGPSIVMFGGEGLNGVTSFYNDMWVLSLSGGVSKGNQTNSSNMSFLKCIPPPDGLGIPVSPSPAPNSPFGPQFANALININHVTFSTLSFIILPIATSIIRFGHGPLIAGIYALFIFSSYAFLIYGFYIVMQQVNSSSTSSINSIPTSHFSTPHGLIAVVLSVLLYIAVPLLTIFSCILTRKFGSYTSETSSNNPDSDDNNISFKNKFAKFFNLKTSDDDDDKQTKSFEVSRPGNHNFQSDNLNHQKPTSMLNKPSSDSWLDKRKSVTIAENPLVLNNALRNLNMQNISSNSRRTSQSTSSYHQRVGSNRYPRGKNSLLVATMKKFGGRGDIDESNDTSGIGNDEYSQASGSEFGGGGGTDSRFNSINGNRANLHDDEMSEEAKQAELEHEITNREVVVMTIPKRRLTVVNA